MFNFSQLVVGVLGWTQVCLWVSQIPQMPIIGSNYPQLRKGLWFLTSYLELVVPLGQVILHVLQLFSQSVLTKKKVTCGRISCMLGELIASMFFQHLLWAKENHPSLWSSLADKKRKLNRPRDGTFPKRSIAQQDDSKRSEQITSL